MHDERVIVGLDAPDDAAVYRLGDGRVVAATVDYFTPLVDGPEDFGAIAAANAFSDLYAMGIHPAFALSILGIPAGEFGPAVLQGIFRGATEVCREAGVVIAGGHSIDDPEPKFGLVALGLGREEAVLRKSGARPGDALVLGKALGIGVITTGIKTDRSADDESAAAIDSMRQLNREAMVRMERFDVHAATDVTGFGLLGHLLEVCRASGVSARVDAGAPELLPGAARLAADGCVPGGTGRNREAVEPHVTWEEGVGETLRILLCDAQTSGGLLAAVPASQADELVQAWRGAGYAAARVGEVREGAGEPRIEVSGGEPS